MNGTASRSCSRRGRRRDCSKSLARWTKSNRLVKMAYFEVPKKSGKTEWTAGIVLFVLLVDPNPGCQVYGAAAATRQAMNVYRAACKMVEQSAMLRKRLRILR